MHTRLACVLGIRSEVERVEGGNVHITGKCPLRIPCRSSHKDCGDTRADPRGQITATRGTHEVREPLVGTDERNQLLPCCNRNGREADTA